MGREHLNDLGVFVEVARAGGFRSAAQKLGLGAASVSQAVQRFEDRLGVRLVERTTRSMSLTKAGRELFERCDSSLSDIETALRAVEGPGDVVMGVLRLTAPESAGPLFLNALVSKYLQQYPEASVEVSYDDRKGDLVTQGFDAAIRSHSLLEQDTFTVAVGPELRMAVVASPGYLEEHGPIKTPADLAAHDGIRFRMPNTGAMAPWNFVGRDGSYEVSARSRVVVNNIEALIHFAVAGVGVAYVYEGFARDHIKDGRLRMLFKGKPVTLPRYTINYVSKRNMPTRLRAFLTVANPLPNNR